MAVRSLESNHMHLREVRQGDCEDRLAIGRHAEFPRLVGGDVQDLAPLTLEDVEAWYRTVESDPL